MSGVQIVGLGYVGLESPSPRDWLDFGTRILGLMPSRVLPGEAFSVAGRPSSGPPSAGAGIAPDGSVFLKADDRQWRIAIHPGGRARLAYLGFELADERSFDAALEQLVRHGVPVELADEKAARSRGVRRLATLADPAGNALELFCLPVSDRHFVSPCDAAFVTGALGLGHVNLLVSDLAACRSFYSEVLGFRLTDFIEFGQGMASHFLRCNPRHHTLGLTRVGDVQGLHHLMLEVATTDAVGAALDRVLDAEIPITSTLGRHKNDRMLSFYFESPSGFDVEIGTGGLRVGDDWVAHEFCEGDVWGHRGLTADAIAASADAGRP